MKRLKEVFEPTKKTKTAEEDTEINRKVKEIAKKFGGCIEKEVLSEKERIVKKEMGVKDKICELEQKEKEVKLKKMLAIRLKKNCFDWLFSTKIDYLVRI